MDKYLGGSAEVCMCCLSCFLQNYHFNLVLPISFLLSPLSSTIFFFFLRFIYLFEKVTQREEKVRERELPCPGSLSKYLRQPGLAQAEGRSPELHAPAIPLSLLLSPQDMHQRAVSARSGAGAGTQALGSRGCVRAREHQMPACTL